MSDPHDYESVPLRYVGTITGPIIRDDTAPPFPHVEGCGPWSPAMELLEEKWRPLTASYEMPPIQMAPNDIRSQLVDRLQIAVRKHDHELFALTLDQLCAMRDRADQSTSGPPAPIHYEGT